MRRLQRVVVSSLIAFFAITVAAAAEPSAEPTEILAPRALLAALRSGGLLLYFRHTSTDFGQSDEAMVSFEDCSKQRNLTDKGRAEARAIGKAIRELEIPIGRVLASPFCRTVETAQLAFGKADKSMDLRGGPALESDSPRYTPLRKLLGAPAPRASNLALVGHGNPFRSVADAPHLREGEAALIKPLGERFEIVARIPLEGWEELLKVK